MKNGIIFVMSELDKEYTYYKKNQKKFLEEYRDKVLVIKGEKIVGIYDDEASAQSFHSRVILF